jgi:hypothetical protein
MLFLVILWDLFDLEGLLNLLRLYLMLFLVILWDLFDLWDP